jgi:hypothetical protein
MSSHARPSARRRLVAPLVLAAALVGGLFALSSPGTAVTDDEGLLASLVNGARAGAGLPPLSVSGALSDVARSHSASMASAGSISHTGNLAGVVGSVVSDWTAVGENVAVAGSVTDAHAAIMGSSAHRANVLGDFNVLGVGVVRSSDGRVWVTELFAKTATVTVDPQPEPVIVQPVDTKVVAPTLVTQPEPVVVEATAPAPPAAAKVRATAKPAPAKKKQPARAPRPATAAPGDEGSCLPDQALPQGQGHAYGRCDDVPRGQAAGRRP